MLINEIALAMEDLERLAEFYRDAPELSCEPRNDEFSAADEIEYIYW
jgi:hypothetical protein